MNKHEMLTNSPLHHFSDREDVFNLPHSDLPRSIPSKTQFQHLIAKNTFSRGRTTKNSSNNSISSKQRIAPESSLKELCLTKIYSPSDYVPHNRLSPVTKLDSRSPKPNRGTAFKERRSRSKVLEINTNSATQLSQQDAVHYLRNTPTPSHNCFDQQKIFENRPSCITPSKLLHSNSVKNSRSQTFENINIRLSNPTSCSHKRPSQPPQTPLSTNIIHRSLSQGSTLIKMSPQRVKARDERNSPKGLLLNSNCKIIERRRSSSRNKRQTPTSELHDDPASRLSTKATLLFSDARRSFPSQKSGSMVRQDTIDNLEEDYRDFSASLKSNLTYETRASETKRFGITKSREASLKEVNNYYTVDRKNNFSEVVQTHNGAILLENGNFDYERDDDRNSMDSTREIIKALGSKRYELDEVNLLSDKEELAHSICYSSHRDSLTRETQGKEFIKTKILLADHFMKEKTAKSSPTGEREAGRILENIMRRNSVREINYNPNAKFLTLRKQVQEKKSKRDAQSIESNKLSVSRENKSLVARSDWNSNQTGNMSSELDMQMRQDMKLSEIFEKTKQMLRNYQDMEKGWQQEKKILLLEILTLQDKVERK